MQNLKYLIDNFIFIFIFIFIFSCHEKEHIYILDDFDSTELGLEPIIYRSNKEFSFDSIIVSPRLLSVYESENFFIVYQKPDSIHYLENIKNGVTISISLDSNSKIDKEVQFIHGKENIDSVRKIFHKTKSIDDTALEIFYKNSFYTDLIKNDTNYYFINKIDHRSKRFNNYIELKEWIKANNINIYKLKKKINNK